MNQRVTCPSGCVHFEWVTADVCVVRTFPHPLAAIDRLTEQPLQPWEWCCVGVVKGNAMMIHGALKSPSPQWMRQAILAVHAIGIPTVQWEHWHGEEKRWRSFSWSRPDWPVATLPSPTGEVTRQTETTDFQATQPTNQNNTMPEEATPTASFKLTLEVKGKETDTLTWENPTCPLTEVSARQAIILGAFADAAKRRATGGSVV